MHANKLAIQLRYDSYKNRWELSTNTDEGTLVLGIRHDWSKEPDDFTVELWDEGTFFRMEEDYIAYVADCQERDEAVPNNIAPMPDWIKDLVLQMKMKWEALNMLATFEVTM